MHVQKHNIFQPLNLNEVNRIKLIYLYFPVNVRLSILVQNSSFIRGPIYFVESALENNHARNIKRICYHVF